MESFYLAAALLFAQDLDIDTQNSTVYFYSVSQSDHALPALNHTINHVLSHSRRLVGAKEVRPHLYALDVRLLESPVVQHPGDIGKSSQGIVLLNLEEFIVSAWTSKYYHFLHYEVGDTIILPGEEGASRAALFRSQVAGGRPRTLLYWYEGTGLYTVSHDTSEDEFRPLRAVIDFEPVAREVIFPRRNGTIGFLIMNSDNKLIQFAPDFVVQDHLAPAPFSKRLQVGISCIRCHGPEDGYIRFPNDMKALIEAGARVPAAVRQAYGDGDRTLDWEQARERYRAILDKIGATSEDVAKIYAWQEYKPVTADVAASEVGYPEYKLKDLLQLRPADEDPAILALCIGIPISRREWLDVEDEVFQRAEIGARILRGVPGVKKLLTAKQIIQDKCAKCHSQEKNPIVAESVADRLLSADPDERMPKDGSLSQAEIVILIKHFKNPAKPQAPKEKPKTEQSPKATSA